MGERLKFSIGHVIAFISLLFIGYVTFMGAVYFKNADFEWAIFAVVVEMTVLFSLLMLLQKMKTVKHNFHFYIWIERIFIVFLIAACGYAFTYFMKFWNVFENRNIVSQKFVEATASADNIFVEYDKYCTNRIDNHRNKLQNDHKLSTKHLLYQVNDTMLCMKLQSPTYKKIENDTRKWVGSTANGVSVWNVFMLGNEQKMASEVDKKYKLLVDMSDGQLSTEQNVQKFDYDNKCIDEVHSKIASLESLFKTDGFTLWSLIGIPAFFFLFLPYMIQDRYFRSTYILCFFHSAKDAQGKKHWFWGRDKSWVERHLNNTIIDVDANTNQPTIIVGGMGNDPNEIPQTPIVTHLGGGQDEFEPGNVVVGGIDAKETPTVNIVEDGLGRESRRRRRGQTFDYDKEDEIQSAVTQMNN